MRRNDRRAAVAAKHMLPPPEPDDLCEHGLPIEDDCPACAAELAEITGEMLMEDAPRAQERRTQ